MSYLIVHARHEIGVFAGIDPAGRYLWTNNSGAIPVIAVTVYPTLVHAERVVDELNRACVGGVSIAQCPADMECPHTGEFIYASPGAVVAAIGPRYSWINEGIICHGNA